MDRAELRKFYNDATPFRKEIKKEDKKLQDHPLIALMIENASIIIPVLIARKILPRVDLFRDGFWKIYLKNLLSFTFMTEGTLAIAFFVANKIYGHHEYFDNSHPEPNYWTYITKKYPVCNLPVTMITSLIKTLLMTNLSSDRKKILAANIAAPLSAISIPKFVGKLIINRFVVDFFFYISHWALHTDLLYETFHKKHHEHHSVSLLTNGQFTITDLFFEAVFPIIASTLVQEELLNLSNTETEADLIANYTSWYEMMSHSGKTIPVQHVVPPLAPIYNPITKMLFGEAVDRDGQLFHYKHHQLKKCNYGISVYWDMLVGTCRFGTKGAVRKASINRDDDYVKVE